MLTGKAKIFNKIMLILCQVIIFESLRKKEASIIKGQETIPFGSTTDDELLLEVQIVRLKFENYEYVLKFLHIIG